MLAQRTFRLPVNKGLPRGFSSEGFAREVTTPAHATAMGLALYSIDHEEEFAKGGAASTESVAMQQPPSPESNQHEKPQQITVEKRGVLNRVRDWFENF